MKRLIFLTFLIIPSISFSRDNSNSLQNSFIADSSIFPSLNKQWTATEFQQVLNTIINTQKVDSANSFALEYPDLFKKITSYDSYWFLESKDYSFNDKAALNLTLSGLIKTILQNYYQKGISTNGKLFYEKEITQFMILLCAMTRNQSDLADQFIKTNPNLTETQLDGIKKINSGMTVMLNGMLLIIEKENMYYSNESICELSKSFKDFYSMVNKKLTIDLKTDFDKKIDAIKASHSNKCVKEVL